MFRFLTAGESHGPGLVTIIEGLPAGLPIDRAAIDEQLRRRQGGYGRGGRMKIERDTVEVLSGIRYGHTLGAPITLRIANRDWANWQERMAADPVETPPEPVTRVRPGHADLTGALKYGHDDVREVIERASSRETAARVAAGAVCRQLLAGFGVAIHSHVLSVAGVGYAADAQLDAGMADADFWRRVDDSEMRCADQELTARMIARIVEGKRQGDTCGGVFEVGAVGGPGGRGENLQWDARLGRRCGQGPLVVPPRTVEASAGGFGLAALPGSQG